MARNRKVKRQVPKWRHWLRRAGIVVLAFVIGSVLLVLPLRWFDPATSAFMLQDNSGRDPLLHQWADWPDLGTAIALAAVASEDQRFADHFGIDPTAIQKSIEEQRRRGYIRGASTITQQTAKNLFLWPGRNFVRKGLEAWFTIIIEICLPKRRILEIYLNIAEFGPGIYGAEAASRYYFGVGAAQLTDRQAALLAAVLPSPRRFRADEPSDYLRNRSDWIVTQVQRLRRESWIKRIGH
jgi:monofunctional glycosyltransferase